jgi:hypothetical protein
MIKSPFKGLYRLNLETLEYKKLSPIKLIIFFLIYTFTIMFWSYYIGYSDGLYVIEKDILNDGRVFDDKNGLHPIKNKVWLDSTFTDYENRANIYLDRPIFEGTPLNGGLLSHCARNAYDSTGILVPLELVLAQAQWESGMGREGRSPINNPFNVGEWDDKTVEWFSSTEEGVQRYYYLMARHYLSCKTVEQLLFDFTNCDGRRYATSNYELHVGEQYHYIKNWLRINNQN